MNRFQPDIWWEWLLRPLVMAAPNGNVYVEIMAPDWRFAFAVGLVILLLLWRRKSGPDRRATWLLLLLVAAGFLPWLATTGNGRYFAPMLLLAGPLCIALVYVQPWSRAARAFWAVFLCVLQGAVAYDTRPWDAWSHAAWTTAPYFHVDLPADVRNEPATFVTITSISYSLLAPQFHPASHWVNITGLATDATQSLDTRRARALFADSKRIYVFVPTVRSFADQQRLPTHELMDTIDRLLENHHLALDRAQSCRMFWSRTAAQATLGPDESRHDPVVSAGLGFWLCPLKYPVEPPPQPPIDKEVEAVFQRVEQSCPRIFPPGTGSTGLLTGGYLRNYPGADMRLYLLGDVVSYKYWRALNMDRIGTKAEVLAPSFKMDCNAIRGRSGLPWQRVL